MDEISRLVQRIETQTLTRLEVVLRWMEAMDANPALLELMEQSMEDLRDVMLRLVATESSQKGLAAVGRWKRQPERRVGTESVSRELANPAETLHLLHRILNDFQDMPLSRGLGPLPASLEAMAPLSPRASGEVQVPPPDWSTAELDLTPPPPLEMEVSDGEPPLFDLDDTLDKPLGWLEKSERTLKAVSDRETEEIPSPEEDADWQTEEVDASLEDTLEEDLEVFRLAATGWQQALRAHSY